MYSVCNEKTKTLADVYVDGELISFRRTFSEMMMQKWDELVSVMEHVVLTQDADSLIWWYEQNVVYSSHSCYNIISYRGRHTNIHSSYLGDSGSPKDPIVLMAAGI
jgi:hypothetical protein